MKRSIYARYGWHLTLFLAALFPCIVYSCIQVMRTGNNNVQQWLPDGFIETTTYDDFREIFHEREISIVSWDGATLDDPRVRALTEELRKPQTGPTDPRRYFSEVTNGAEMVERLMGEPFGFSRELAIQRLRSFAIGLDDATCGVMFGMTPAGDVKRRFSIDAMYELASQATGLPKEKLRMAGAPVANAAVDRESAQSIVGYVGLAILAGGLVAGFSLRSFRLIAIILLVSGYCGLAGLSLVWPLGGRMNLVLVVMPVLVGMVGLSGAIHMVGYYREAVMEVGREKAALHTVKMCWMPCFLSSFTTSLGLVSLCVSEIRPVRDFGFFSAIGTIVGFTVLMAWTPALLEIWPGKKKRDDADMRLSHVEEVQYAWLINAAEFIVRHRNVV
ncbi:MAG TPA: MMPL family transporter, partial [Pirellulales bacterium]